MKLIVLFILSVGAGVLIATALFNVNGGPLKNNLPHCNGVTPEGYLRQGGRLNKKYYYDMVTVGDKVVCLSIMPVGTDTINGRFE